jgi:hypothetical protein
VQFIIEACEKFSCIHHNQEQHERVKSATASPGGTKKLQKVIFHHRQNIGIVECAKETAR